MSRHKSNLTNIRTELAARSLRIAVLEGDVPTLKSVVSTHGKWFDQRQERTNKFYERAQLGDWKSSSKSLGN